MHAVEQRNGQLQREMQRQQQTADERRAQVDRAHAKRVAECEASLRDAAVRARVECDQRLANHDEYHEHQRAEAERRNRATLDARLAECATHRDECAATIASLTARAERDAAALVARTNECEALATRLTARQKSQRACQVDLRRVRAAYDRCASSQRTASSSTAIEPTANPLHASLVECQSRLQATEHAVRDVERRLADAQSDAHAAARRQDECHAQLRACESRYAAHVDDVQADAHAAARRQDECHAQLRACESRYEAHVADAQAAHAQWTQSRVESAQRLAAKQAECDALTRRLEELGRESTRLQSAYAHVHAQCEASAREVERLTTWTHVQSTEASAQRDAHAAQQRDLVAQHAAQQRDLVAQHEACDLDRCERLDEYERRIHAVQSEHGHCRRRLDDAMAEAEAEKAAHAATKAQTTRQLADLQAALHRSASTHALDRDAVETLTAQLAHAAQALEASDERHHAHVARLAERERDLGRRVAEWEAVRAAQYDAIVRAAAPRTPPTTVERGSSPAPPVVVRANASEAPWSGAPRKRRRPTPDGDAAPDVDDLDADDDVRAGRRDRTSEASLAQRLRASEALVHSARSERDDERAALRQRTRELAEAEHRLDELRARLQAMDARTPMVDEETPASDADADADDPNEPNEPLANDLNADDVASWNETNHSWCVRSQFARSLSELHAAHKELDDVSCQCYAKHNVSCRSVESDSPYPLRCVSVDNLSPCSPTSGRKLRGEATFDGKSPLFYKFGRYASTKPVRGRSFTDPDVVDEHQRRVVAQLGVGAVVVPSVKSTRVLRSHSNANRHALDA